MSCLRIEQVRIRHMGPVDLTVHAAECVALAGASGSGKTLLLRALADLDPYQGRVSLDAQDCASMPAPQWRGRVGLLAAESQWWFDTVGAHFATDVPSAWLHRLALDERVMTWEVARCSTGERQRLALLRLLAGRPRALLLDEPTASLDPDGAQAVEALVADYRRQQQAAVVWVSHDAQQARRVARRCFRVEQGQLVEQAT